MKAGKLLSYLLFIITVSLFAWGCSQEDGDDNGAVQTDEQVLKEMIVSDSAIEHLSAWDGENDDPGGGLDEPVTPIHWRRLANRSLVSVQVDFRGDTFATITRTVSFDGVIRIVTDTTGGIRQYLDKEMHNTLVRKAHAVRVNRSRYPRLNWRITEVSPEVLASAAPNPHTVWPARVQVVRMGETPEVLADITDPHETWFNRDNLPSISAEDEIVLYVTPNRENVDGFLHPRVWVRGPHPRLALHDDGVFPDVNAGDGIYSGSYIAGTQGGVYLAGVDLLDHETLFDSVLPYDAGGWAIPYRVIPNR